MSKDRILEQVVEITNDIDNFIPYATLFVTNWPGLMCVGQDANLKNGDGWKWVDFPFSEIDGISPIAIGLRLLIRKAYCRLTYKVFDQLPGIMIIRVYLLPSDSQYSEIMNSYRQNFFRFKMTVNWLEKRCMLMLENLVTLADFSDEAFNINSAKDLIYYTSNHKIMLINVMADTMDNLNNIDPETLKYHIDRLVNRKSFEPKPKSGVINSTKQPSILSRLNKIYQRVESPKINLDNLFEDDDKLNIYDKINNNEIKGFKSELYNFQKRSVLKMFERESVQNYKLMPNIIEIKNNLCASGNYYFDIKTLTPVLKSPLYLPPRGGILAENMGLGKTCICLALICLSKFEVSETPNSCRDTSSTKRGKVNSLFDTCVNFITQNSIPWKEYYEDFPPHITKQLETTMGYFEKSETSANNRKTRTFVSKQDQLLTYKKYFLSSTTLIVLPDNLFHQWKVEIFKHVEKDYLKLLEIPTLKQNHLLGEFNIRKLLNNDIVLISISVFSKQFEISNSAIRYIYWKRLIIDEGHSMNSKTSRAVLLTKDLMYERMWVISGTPTSGLTNLHIENELQEYSVQKNFDPKQDLIKLGSMVANFFKVEPWSLNKKLWMESIVKPFEKNEFNIDIQLSKLLDQFIVKHTIKDVESDIKLPTLHHKPIFLKPSFYDKLSINLFVSVLATNAVTSQRKDVDFMFHPSNKSDLRRLVTNLQKATFYWTGFSINDIENLLNICVYSLRENNDKYSERDNKLLNNSIFISKLALSNMRWRSVSTVHEMGYYVSYLPTPIVESYSVVNYINGTSVYGYPHLISIQKFYYKNRTIKTVAELKEKLTKQSSEFWKSYWSNIKGSKKNNKSITNRPLSNKEEYKEFELSDVQVISQIPTWVETFDPVLEESILYGKKPFKLKKNKHESNINYKRMIKTANIGSVMRDALITGTLSTKLNYLTMRLLENQSRGIKSIVFYEFENSAYYLTEFMDLLGMNYLMYSPYIKVSDRANNLAQFDRWEPENNEGEGISLIMDLKLASHGLTIIAATHVFFINPVWNQSVEAQAIKRSHRIGQMNEVFVETLILENTLEEEMYKMRSDVKDLDGVELIDHTKIKDYILTFPYLKMYVDQSYDQEYSGLNVPTDVDGDIGFTNSKLNNKYDIELKNARGEYNPETRTRNWTLPLFTKQNLNKLAMNDNKSIKRRFDDIEDLENEEANKTANGSINGSSISKTSSLLDKLRSKRKKKVRFKL
ncbi:hypothetical protein C6P40_005031 [Pichia californica]|uniref:Helicase C-terminal domain-containing protein n=1 Tax=Pichia californica TaxID=460514 RepID=A0A9P7BFY2_9ASCO|nr:hypothetical protein C6P42_004018 [[Candida] californica]KAG0691112.1 hypothetical protein C6P40_005031 [[Candida] californica]